jgi:ribonuclease P protein component
MTAGDLDSSPLGRLVRPADYVRVLATPLRLRSPHFAVHHMDGRPLLLKRPMARADVVAVDAVASTQVEQSAHAPVTASLSTELSTGAPVALTEVVDDSVETPAARGGLVRWLGLVVPKRHAKRAVTRTLVKRQIRNVAAACAAQLEPGLWVVRLRSPFDPKHFTSAASDALKEAARDELRALFERAVRGERDRVKPRPPGDAPARGPRSGKGAKAPAAPRNPPPDVAQGSPCAA